MKSREKIVKECTQAVRVCFNHYVDEPLTDDEIMELLGSLDKLLPQSISTDEWQEASDEFDARVEEHNWDVDMINNALR